MRLWFSDRFPVSAALAALSILRRDRVLPWTRVLAMPIVALAVSGFALPKETFVPNVLPSAPATIGQPYKSTYSCKSNRSSVAGARCRAAGLPAGLNVDPAPGCTSRANLSAAGRQVVTITCTISGTPMAAGRFNVVYDCMAFAVGGAPGVGGQVSRPFVVLKVQPSVVLTAQPNPASVGQIVTFTATLKTASGPSPTGEVGLFIPATDSNPSTTTVQKANLVNGAVKFTLPANMSGTTSYGAAYVGDSNYLGQFSLPINLVVK